MQRPRPPRTSETTVLTAWQDPLAMAAPTPSLGWEAVPGGGELQRRATACYAQLRALPRRVRRALQRKLALPLVSVALLLALGPGPSQAATTWTVCARGCNYTTIQAAINAATTAAGDLISVRDAVHTEAGITVTKALVIEGQGADTTVVQAAATPDTAHDRVFTIAPGVTVTIRELTIRHGSPRDVDGGGGLFNQGTLTLTNSTVSGNSATFFHGYSEGGGLFIYNGTVSLTNSTLSGNSADVGGGLVNLFGTLTLTNSIIANHPDGGDCRNASGSLISHGYNLDSDGSCQLTAPTDRPGVDPLLGPLQDNGGPTFTHALLPGSPALDAIPWGTNGCGTTLISDQRWQARPQGIGGSCDIGAYEAAVAGQPLSDWVTGLTPQTVTCKDVTTGQVVTLNDPATSWDCEAEGIAVTSGNQVSMRVRGTVDKGATDVGGAIVGMAPSTGGCTNLITGQQVAFQHMVGATAGSCVAAGLVVHPGDKIQLHVQGGAE